MQTEFLKRVQKTDNCWIWIGAKSYCKGYGFYRTKRAHRIAYELWVNPIPDGLVVRHKCDNGLCVNPQHLEVGTQADNMRDKVERGRQAKGEKHAKAFKRPNGENHKNSKLKDDEVREIKVLLGFYTLTELAKLYNVSIDTIWNIKQCNTWKHI